MFDDQDNASVERLPPGYYNLESMAKAISGLLKKYKVELSTELNTPVGQLVITNPGSRKIVLDRDVSDLLGIGWRLLYKTFVIRFQYPTTYFVHCDLLDKTQNFLNRKRSVVLAQFDIRGEPYEKVSYTLPPQNVFRSCATDSFINSIALSVRDENDSLFNFHGLALKFELEIN